MFDKESILKLAGKFLPQEKIQTLSQAYDFANKLTDMTQDPREVLKKAGVTSKDIETAKKLANSRVGRFVLGDKYEAVINGVTKAESYLTPQVNSLPEQAPSSELERLQASLAQLK